MNLIQSPVFATLHSSILDYLENPFYTQPILNSPYEPPKAHWELDATGQPTQRLVQTRRPAKFETPIPKPRKRNPKQTSLVLNELSTENQAYDTLTVINDLRRQVELWRLIPNSADWKVTPETARLLKHWRQHPFSSVRPFFCQVEAVETAIWLAEVAPKVGKVGRAFLDHLEDANRDANPDLFRLALKLATGAGKTTVMAMLIAWQTINARRRPGSDKFTSGFLVVAPGLTIKDRLQVLQPNDPNSYYGHRELVPTDLLPEIGSARIVITNYHAFKLRERFEISRVGRALLQGHGEAPQTEETEGQMIQRVMPELMGVKNIVVINDEAHHCYREKPEDKDGGVTVLKGEEKAEAQQNNEAARLWISGLEAVKRKLGIQRVIDLSATPFFLRGSGYAEGTLFPWTMSDFSLMDAIECGIVKLPRVPVADNIPGSEMPKFRNLWENIRALMPKKGRGKAGELDPDSLPTPLLTALDALYGHYEKTFKKWKERNIQVPPCFIIVCNNTSTSKLVYDYVSGFLRTQPDGTSTVLPGRLALFQNYDEHGNPLARPQSLLIDSEQLESGNALDDRFRAAAAPEIERFRQEKIQRGGQGEGEFSEAELLREVMNTVGKRDQLGESIRCVVSVSMLTEGWDANTVTHVLGVRAFGTQLLCEQVIGRALRRQSYELNEHGLFDVEYADVLGIPFDFTAKPVVAPPQAPPETIRVQAVRPERDSLEIRFPRVAGYRVDLPKDHLEPQFNADSVLELTPVLTGPSSTQNAGIIGEIVDLNLRHTGDLRTSTLVFHLTKRLLYTRWRDAGEDPEMALFYQLKSIVKQWLDTCLVCSHGIHPAALMYQSLADRACDRIMNAIVRSQIGTQKIKIIPESYNPIGSTNFVAFNTSKTHRWQADARKCHVNWVVLDSDWEGEFCRVVENHPCVKAYVKNHGLGFEVPYRCGSEIRRYLPDFIVQVNDGRPDPLNLVIEIKGFRGEDAKDKKNYMETHWVPGVNNHGGYGRWAFAEFTEVYRIASDFEETVAAAFNKLLDQVTVVEVA